MGATCNGMDSIPGTIVTRQQSAAAVVSGLAHSELDPDHLWIQYIDEERGIPYFHNISSLETTWQPPEHYLVHPSVVDYVQESVQFKRRGSSKQSSRRCSLMSTSRPFYPSPPVSRSVQLDSPKDLRRRFVVICAVEEEAIHFRKLMSRAVDIELGGTIRRTRGLINKLVVDLIVSGIGIINATSAATAAVLEGGSSIYGMISVGCSGAHLETLRRGDVVIATSIVPIGSYKVTPDGKTEFKGFQSVVGKTNPMRITSDSKLLRLAQRRAAAVRLPKWPGSDDIPRVVSGPVASSDTWTQKKATILFVHKTFETCCEEMEAAGVCSVASRFGIAFLAIKDISNNELSTETVKEGLGLDLEEIGKRAAILAADLIESFSEERKKKDSIVADKRPKAEKTFPAEGVDIQTRS
uniref:WW domain-containing protein n=1 Tax=Amorphochlora amoebiformis TaxID=1561963 RepID=A0A7S0DTN5_9EUKA